MTPAGDLREPTARLDHDRRRRAAETRREMFIQAAGSNNQSVGHPSSVPGKTTTGRVDLSMMRNGTKVPGGTTKGREGLSMTRKGYESLDSPSSRLGQPSPLTL